MSQRGTTSGRHIVLTAGGTGGHLFPALSLAEALISRGDRVTIITDERGRRFQEDSKSADYKIRIVKISSPTGNLWHKLKCAVSLLKGYLHARRLLGKDKPDAVIGFGGYPSFPIMLAAQHLKICNIIHEQNAVIGKANLAIARKADFIAISLPHIAGLSSREEEKKVVYTGNPVRSEIQKLSGLGYPVLRTDEPFNILVLGGSQGASVFGEVVPEALNRLPAHEKKRLYVVQQCREEDLQTTRQAFDNAGISHEVRSFFNDIPERLRAAHLVISRSGASTVAEVTAAGRPAIFVPYPWHKDQQQKMNADVVADNGGAWVMAQNGFTPKALEAKLMILLQDPSVLEKAAEKSRECAVTDAAEKLADLARSKTSTSQI